MDEIKQEDVRRNIKTEFSHKLWIVAFRSARLVVEYAGLLALYLQISSTAMYQRLGMSTLVRTLLVATGLVLSVTAVISIKKAFNDFDDKSKDNDNRIKYKNEKKRLQDDLDGAQSQIACLGKRIEMKQKELDLLKNILNSINTVRASNFMHLVEHIGYHFKSRAFIEIITNPHERLVAMANDIQSRVLELFDKEDRNDIDMSFVYNYPENKSIKERTWDCIIPWNISYDMNDLIKNRRSTFYSVLVGDSYAFHNVKGDVVIDDSVDDENISESRPRYYRLKSESSSLTGSIICQRIFVKKESDVYIEALFSISTKEKPFISNDDMNKKAQLEQMLKEHIFTTYVAKIQLELAYFFIKGKRKQE